jgi:chromosome partitioning protein
LALAHRDVLLVDIDPQGSASSGLGIRDLEGESSTYDLLVGERSATDLVRPSPVERLHVLPANRDLVGAEVELVSALAREYRLKEGLQAIRDRYELILIDCPPSLGLLTINALTAADSVLIPLQCEYYALEGLTALNETIQLIRERLNPRLELAGVLLTMFDSRNSLSHQVSEEVRAHFPGRVYKTVIPRNVRLSEAPSHGLPVALYDPSSRGAQAYVELVTEIIESETAAPQVVQTLEGGESDGGS